MRNLCEMIILKQLDILQISFYSNRMNLQKPIKGNSRIRFGGLIFGIEMVSRCKRRLQTCDGKIIKSLLNLFTVIYS